MTYKTKTAESGTGAPMPTLVTGEALHAAIKGETFVRGGDPNAVEMIKYDLHLGSRVLKSNYGLPKEIDSIPEEKRWIEPGEIVFVVTKEQFHLPPDMFAVLSPKRAVTHRGIMALGGLAIDPGYKGLLWFGLQNFASTRFPLIVGTKLIGCMFYKLELGEEGKFDCPETEPVTDFPEDLIDLIKNYKPVELKGLIEELGATKAEIAELKKSLGDDKTWRDEFKGDLTKILEGLDKEITARQAADEKLQGKLDNVSNMFARLSVVGYIITAALGGGGLLLIQWIWAQFGHHP